MIVCIFDIINMKIYLLNGEDENIFHSEDEKYTYSKNIFYILDDMNTKYILNNMKIRIAAFGKNIFTTI